MPVQDKYLVAPAAERLPVSGLSATAEERQELREVFDIANYGGGDTLDATELDTMSKILHLEKDGAALLEVYDLDGDGEVSFDEFLQVAMAEKKGKVKSGHSHQQLMQARKIKQAFVALDADKSGTLDAAEVENALQRLGVGAGEEMDELMEKLDKDGSGQVSWSEFIKFMVEQENRRNDSGICGKFDVQHLSALPSFLDQDKKVSEVESKRVWGEMNAMEKLGARYVMRVYHKKHACTTSAEPLQKGRGLAQITDSKRRRIRDLEWRAIGVACFAGALMGVGTVLCELLWLAPEYGSCEFRSDAYACTPPKEVALVATVASSSNSTNSSNISNSVTCSSLHYSGGVDCDSETGDMIFYWTWTLIISSILTVFELLLMYEAALSSAVLIADAVGLRLYPMDHARGHIVAGLTRCALQIGNPRELTFGINPLRYMPATLLLCAAVLYSGRRAITKFAVRILLRRASPRVLSKVGLSTGIDIAINCFWNVLIMRSITRQSRVLALGPNAAVELLNGILQLDLQVLKRQSQELSQELSQERSAQGTPRGEGGKGKRDGKKGSFAASAGSDAGATPACMSMKVIPLTHGEMLYDDLDTEFLSVAHTPEAREEGGGREIERTLHPAMRLPPHHLDPPSPSPVLLEVGGWYEQTSIGAQELTPASNEQDEEETGQTGQTGQTGTGLSTHAAIQIIRAVGCSIVCKREVHPNLLLMLLHLRVALTAAIESSSDIDHPFFKKIHTEEYGNRVEPMASVATEDKQKRSSAGADRPKTKKALFSGKKNHMAQNHFKSDAHPIDDHDYFLQGMHSLALEEKVVVVAAAIIATIIDGSLDRREKKFYQEVVRACDFRDNWSDVEGFALRYRKGKLPSTNEAVQQLVQCASERAPIQHDPGRRGLAGKICDRFSRLLDLLSC